MTYLYEGLKDQAIWQSTRFWNAAIFIALQEERYCRQVISSKFAWRMYSFGLSKDACLDFLRKQVEDTSLSKGETFI
ncbi:unnamed protein product [Rodentolepis nana]|uniref:SBF1/SBF2 domain-containing protein n=1 Tax=Rodentolepis nana TaxID=102285 RepID=A0A3P7SYI8_RODNA|nr:unnamed protein product [Rodentolepis nana]